MLRGRGKTFWIVMVWNTVTGADKNGITQMYFGGGANRSEWKVWGNEKIKNDHKFTNMEL